MDFTLASDGDDGEHFNVTHLMIHKSIKFYEAGNHWIFFSGNDRVVEQNCIDNQIGLKFIGDHSDCVYIGIVPGEYLNNHINQERTKFTFDHGIMQDLQKMAQRSCLEFLAPYILQVRKKQVDTANEIIRNNPQFISFKDHFDEFVKNNLPLNTQSEEEIFLELSR